MSAKNGSGIYFSAKEMDQVAQMKRFNEWLQADSELRKRLGRGKGQTEEQREWMSEIGIETTLRDISFFWKHPLTVVSYLELIMKSRGDEIENKIKDILDEFPLLALWGKYYKTRNFNRISAQNAIFNSTHENFDLWRKRRIASAKSELGFYGLEISPAPAFSFELNNGCSVGCWFCSFAVHRLSATFDYPKMKEEALNIVRHCRDIFGIEMLQLSLPYYRTEPHDNPHYIEFLKDFEKETGAVLCTATAVCTDIEWIKSLLRYYQHREDGKVHYWPRLSILTTNALRKIHTAFTPLELRDTDLLIQVKDTVRPKVTGGRILKEHAGLKEVENLDTIEKSKLAALVPQGTISCVSGFNINLATRTIMLFSPCYTSAKWPHGFRVFGEAIYEDATDFPTVIKELIDKCAFTQPPKDKILKFRDDITFRRTEEGFDLATPNQLHHFKDNIYGYSSLGQLIAEGAYTYAQITESLVKEDKVIPATLTMAVQHLFNNGYIDEIYEG